jgi:methionine sulfoxide reductase heme-binding subunit
MPMADQPMDHEMPTPATARAGHITEHRREMSTQPGQAAGHSMPALAPDASTAMDHSPSQDGTRANANGASLFEYRELMARFTTATGYVALGFLALTLLIGPANLLLRRRNPVSSYLRRDVGMWTAIVSVVHVIAGLQVHAPPIAFPERIARYFFAPEGTVLTDVFGLGNWTGLAATVIVLGLLAISNDFALRKLKAGPWKWLQRLNYALFVLAVAHAVYYAAFGGSLLRITAPSSLLLVPAVVVVVVGQALGVRPWRRRHVRTTVQQPELIVASSPAD